ncbi:response regulator [Pedobacter sp. Du54]|uniref:response regulator n=1 Tax=Pedobacter anseongensis TaxID=3133439 RepID=UPI00309C6ECF
MEMLQKEFKVLVIEDNVGDYELVELYLKEHFPLLILHHATSFSEAKSVLKIEAPSLDVILLDLSLPDTNGSKLINQILAISSNTPILVLTGYEDVAFGVKSLAKGVADYIIKDDLTSTLLYKSILYSIERKKAITALQESEKQYSELFHLSPQPMWVFEPKKNLFLDANEAAVRQYGYLKEEFLSMSSEEINQQLNVYGTCDIKEDPKVHSPGICIHKKKNGEYIKVDIHRNSIEYKGQEAFIILANDVSDRLDYIKAIEVQNKKLKEISWIQSHKVRAPVARILGLVGLIKDENSDDKNQIIDYLYHSANELDDVIKDINKKINRKEIQRLIHVL